MPGTRLRSPPPAPSYHRRRREPRLFDRRRRRARVHLCRCNNRRSLSHGFGEFAWRILRTIRWRLTSRLPARRRCVDRGCGGGIAAAPPRARSGLGHNSQRAYSAPLTRPARVMAGSIVPPDLIRTLAALRYAARPAHPRRPRRRQSSPQPAAPIECAAHQGQTKRCDRGLCAARLFILRRGPYRDDRDVKPIDVHAILDSWRQRFCGCGAPISPMRRRNGRFISTTPHCRSTPSFARCIAKRRWSTIWSPPSARSITPVLWRKRHKLFDGLRSHSVVSPAAGIRGTRGGRVSPPLAAGQPVAPMAAIGPMRIMESMREPLHGRGS